jgi:two-component system cell cycle response regulator
VVVCSASRAADARIEAFRAGADDFLTKPLDDQTLLARIRGLMRAREALAGLGAGFTAAASGAILELAEAASPFQRPATVAMVLQRPETAMFLKRNLATRLPDKLITFSAEHALAISLQDGPAPDLFLIDADLDIQGGGLRLMSDLRSRAATRNAGFALLSSGSNAVSPAMAFDLGANDVIPAKTMPVEMALRLQRLLALKQEADSLRASVQDGLKLAVIDPLTGLHNRRFGQAQLQTIAEKAKGTNSAFAVLVADIDRFKSINDRFGHAAGDAVLVKVAQRLRQNLRSGDLIARIGGEEFLIALPDIALTEARSIAERLCAAISDEDFDLGRGKAIGVTLSIGLAISEAGATPLQIETVTDIFERADRALMRSKASGRNQVTISRRAA